MERERCRHLFLFILILGFTSNLSYLFACAFGALRHVVSRVESNAAPVVRAIQCSALQLASDIAIDIEIHARVYRIDRTETLGRDNNNIMVR